MVVRGNELKRVMISSTALDLPEHRAEAMDACLRADTKPEAMEHLPAEDASAIEVSLAMVDRADIYVGIFGWRYGHVPEGHDISITEMEFDRALERGIPILVFLMDDEHPISISMVDNPRDNVEALREKVCDGRVRQTFTSPTDLRGLIVQSVGEQLKKLEAAEESDEPAAPQLHRFSSIPEAPEPYVAHPYTLLPTKDLVGRAAELRWLTDWVTGPESEQARVSCIVAIGGMGKSALTWKWFQDIAPQELRGKLAGRMWWSFYESDASFENFVIRALAYVSGQSEETVRSTTNPGEREDQLLRILDEQPFLLVLDGLERILIAYARLDAARLLDDDLDERTMNQWFDARGVPVEMREWYLSKHRLRMTADARAGQFLRRLSRTTQSRVLITTRLFPADLQNQLAQPLPGSKALFLKGLSDEDALRLWREFGARGTTDQLASVFAAVENYPLLIRALAGEVAGFRPAPGDFDAWLGANPSFDPAQLDLANARTHVLNHALTGLDDEPRAVLRSIVAFRMPATYETVQALHVGDGKVCGSDRDLDVVLTELEDRGLVGWDKDANRYDVHPIVRSVVWDRLHAGDRERIYSDLHDYFDAIPKTHYEDVENLDDLTGAIELYRSLIGLHRYDDAYAIFREHLDEATLYRLAAHRERIELLEPLFPVGADHPPQLSARRIQGHALNALATAYQFSGEPGRAAAPFRLAVEIDERNDDPRNAAVGWSNLSDALLEEGRMRHAHHAAVIALRLFRQLDERFGEAVTLQWLGLVLAECGVVGGSEHAVRRSVRLFTDRGERQSEGVATAILAQRQLWFGDPESARDHADRAWTLAFVHRLERDFMRAARLQGVAALALGDLDVADERLHHALPRARSTNTANEELPILVALAQFEHRRGNPYRGRDHLDHVWEPATRGPYPLHHADAHNVLGRIELDAGNHHAAVTAATRAYEIAWCDGPPYAIHHALAAARTLLEELDAPIPDLEPFDESKFDPLPDVEIDPD